MTDVKQSACTLAQSLELSDLNSDELLTRFNSNQSEIARLEIENKLLVSLVRANGFLIRDTNSAAREVAAWVELVIPDRAADENALTVDELKAGGWWLRVKATNDVDSLARRGLNVCDSENWPLSEHLYAITDDACQVVLVDKFGSHRRQIHRKGNNFYWGAPE